MNKNLIISLVVVVLLVGGGYYFSSNGGTPKGAPSSAQDQAKQDVTTVKENPGSVATNTQATSVTVAYTDSGFVPSTVTIKQGTEVTFINQTSNRMWVASDPHPTHEGYSGTTKNVHCPDTAGTAFDQCSSGNSYTFTFGKIGTWGYHNHSSSGDKGTIIVTQ